MLVVGGYSPNAPRVYDLEANLLPASFLGLGPDSLTLTGSPGVVYDEAIDKYLIFHNWNGSVNTFDVDGASLTVSRPATLGIAPAARMNGIQNSVQYVPELRGVVLANRHDGNVQFMRTSA